MTPGGGRFTVVDGAGDRIVNVDAAQAPGTVRQAVVVLQATDELTGAPVVAPVSIATQVAGLTPAAADSGYAGLIGVPLRVFPSLATQPYMLDIAVHVPGYSPWSRVVTVPAQPLDAFAAVDLGIVALHRVAVSIGVRTVSLDAHNRPQPLAGAAVRVSAIWRRLTDLTGAGAAANLISLPLGVSQAWPAGTALDSVSLLGSTEPQRRLARAASPGERSLDVDVLGALAAGDLVGLDTADVDRREYLPVTAVDTADANSPANVQTAEPVRTAHARWSTARRVPAPPGAPADATVIDPAEAGDTTVFVDTVAPFAPVEIVRASGGGLSDEYLDSHLFQATTDLAGFARLPTLSRVAAVELAATKGALIATTRFTPDYSSPANSVVLTLR
jgi:hypothetical protein